MEIWALTIAQAYEWDWRDTRSWYHLGCFYGDVSSVVIWYRVEVANHVNFALKNLVVGTKFRKMYN